jgi:hypothetical protein
MLRQPAALFLSRVLGISCLATPLMAQTKAAQEAPAPAEATVTNSGSSAAADELFTLDASWVYSHFGTEIPGATGPRLGLRLRLVEHFHLGVLVDGKIGLEPSTGSSVGVLDATFGLSASYEFLPFLSATLAPILALSGFIAPTETTSDGSSTIAGGALLLVRGKIPLRDAHPFLELGVQATTPARQAVLNGSPVLTVPDWQAQVAIGVELPL